MGDERVLDGHLMEVELSGGVGELPLRGLVEAEPNKATPICGGTSGAEDGKRSAPPATVLVHGTVDDHRIIVASQRQTTAPKDASFDQVGTSRCVGPRSRSELKVRPESFGDAAVGCGGASGSRQIGFLV